MIEQFKPIVTKRLVLRPFTARDEEDMLEFESREDVARYLFNEPRTREDNARELAARQTKTALRKQGDTLIPAIELDGKVIGYTVLSWLSEQNRQGEFGYVLHPDFGGQGYATEAGIEMLRLGFEEMRLYRIIGRCDARNTGSARVMERIGMRKEAHFVGNEIFKGEWGEELVYAMLESEWKQSPWA
ncbi:GNAT family N-acetyltransferase [Phytoactinopolyspora mesophila]|uniref:GNAT family N-acetyltransferase n=1 Tax=Phytoactinopolyspora mesophila TaxID=2650750 RepID=A0A7K3M7A0_9ACTN|nr:GNAT family N-acetyltransferase [Phytoactinopolyspora mesophila]NDL58288.1 GNAT family N-acetyltransferase [Phytoactinopolyspora mesophila]